MYREYLQGLHLSKRECVPKLHPGNLQAGSGGGSPTLGQLTCWHACPCQLFLCHRTFLCSELSGKNVGFLNTLKNSFLTVALGNKYDGKTKLHFSQTVT